MQGMPAGVSSSVDGDSPLALEGCCEHHLYGLHLKQGTRQPFPGQGPELPPPLSPCHAHMSMCVHRTSGFRKGGDRWQTDRMSPSVILFLWFTFQAVTVNLFYLSLCKSLCRIKPFTRF